MAATRSFGFHRLVGCPLGESGWLLGGMDQEVSGCGSVRPPVPVYRRMTPCDDHGFTMSVRADAGVAVLDHTPALPPKTPSARRGAGRRRPDCPVLQVLEHRETSDGTHFVDEESLGGQSL